MSRIIKFRAWNKDANRYSKPFGLKSTVLNFTDEDGLGIMKSLTNEDIEQFTGFIDKNGKEIYEGDFVTDSSIGYNYLMEVYWDDRFQWSLRLPKVNNNFSGRLSNDKDIVPKEMKIQVIGNIYENPELLQS